MRTVTPLSPSQGPRRTGPMLVRLLLVGLVGAMAGPGLGISQEISQEVVESSWNAVPVPEVWKNPPANIQAEGSGFGWYRARFQAGDDWGDRDALLMVEAADDARQYFLNGQLVASSGNFPPRYRSGLGEQEEHALPRDSIRPGEENQLAIRVYQQQSRTNFNVAAPVIVAGDEAIQLKGTWELHLGDLEPTQAVGSMESDIFREIIPTSTARATWKLLDSDEGPLPIDEALARFRIPDDLAIELAVGEPDIGQPLSLKFDERGRMWVLQYLQYPSPAGLTMVSRDKFLRTVWDKVPAPPPHHVPGHDKITIHEDTTGDGHFDKMTTFVDDLNIASSFAIAKDGVWVLNPPYLLFYPDRDRDDRPDGPPEVHLEGFGLEDSHSIANSLRFGPDGWLYAGQGSTVTGQVKRWGSDDPPVSSMGQLIWRYHPTRRKYEVFAEGGGNTFGVEIDAKGRLYSGHNGGDTRGFHYVQGGYYQKGFGKHGELSNPFTYGYFPPMGHHAVPRFSHTFIFYEAQSLPERYWGQLFGVGPLQGHVMISDVEPDRSSFKTQDVGFAFTTNDPWCRPVDIQLGPDGAIYVADFYEQRIDHASHYQGRIHRESGRIYRLRGRDAVNRLSSDFDLRKSDTKQLVQQLRDPNRWMREASLRVLVDRRDPDSLPLLRAMLRDEVGQPPLESLWALYQMEAWNEELAIEGLRHADPYVRLWTVRLLGDEREVSSRVAEELRDVARREPHVEVRSQLAASTRRLATRSAFPIVAELLRRDEDVSDIHIPLLLWWSVEARAGSEAPAIMELFSDDSLWSHEMVREQLLERLMRRFAESGSRASLLVCAELLKMAPDEEAAERLMKGFEKAYEGRLLTGLPDELVEQMSRVGGGSFVLRLRQGDAEALAEAMARIADEATETAQRTLYVQVLGQVRHEPSVPVLLDLVKNSPRTVVRSAALTALQTFASQDIAEEIIAMHDELPTDLRGAAQSMLAGRPDWSYSFLRSIAEGASDPKLVPLSMVQRLLLHDDSRIADLVESLWGDVEGASTDQMRETIERLTEVIADGVGNPYNGKVIYAEQCGKCHTLFHQGGEIGPDLTSFRRDDVHGMLVNIVNPSLEIREGYENYVVVTDDGRTLNGFLVDQDNQTVVLRDSEGQTTVVAREEIEEMHAIPRSMMPEGILEELAEQQVRDLFAYLRSTQPLP